MKKKIGELTLKEVTNICRSHHSPTPIFVCAAQCPFYKNDICCYSITGLAESAEEILDQEIEVEDDKQEKNMF